MEWLMVIVGIAVILVVLVVWDIIDDHLENVARKRKTWGDINLSHKVDKQTVLKIKSEK
jgi:hypothetical protein